MQARKIPCSCGAQINDCFFWSGYLMGISANTRDFCTNYVRMRYFIFEVIGKRISKLKNGERAKTEISNLYKNIAMQHDNKVLLDTSKNPAYRIFMATRSEIDVKFIHLVRNPVDVVNSYSKTKIYLLKQPLLKVLMAWALSNSLAEKVKTAGYDCVTIRYEDFINSPVEICKKIIQDLRLPNDRIQWPENEKFPIGVQHALAGNPDKLDVEEYITIKKRLSNNRELSLKDKFVLLLSRSGRKKYGY